MEAATTQNFEGPDHGDIADILRWRARREGARVAYSFLKHGAIQNMSYADLDRRARALAARLIESGLHGKRAVLCVPTGEHFVVALYACVYGSVTAVPVFTPRKLADVAHIAAIARDCDAEVLLTVRQNSEAISALGWGQLATTNAIPLLEVDEPSTSNPRATATAHDRKNVPVILQYTSGSTGAPKGVVLQHGNLIANLEAIRRAFSHDRESRVVIWLPPYHDMGLIGGILHPLYAGIPALLMSPTRFLKNPLSWLEAIESYRATTSGGPNFAYDLCVRRSTPEQRARLNLSSWRVAFCGAEPVRADTLQRFSEAFQCSGFQRSAFLPCFGLAEATLMVTGGGKRERLTVDFDADRLSLNHAVAAPTGAPSACALVSCGPPVEGTCVSIVDPVTRRPAADGEIGEVWVAGPAVAGGYWNNAAATAEVFHARRAGETRPYFLRTGDLGFTHDGELFITGRRKDLIVVHGVNHYPQDIEATAQASDRALRKGRGVAFPVPGPKGELVVLVQEFDGQANELSQAWGARLVAGIESSIAERHGLPLAEVLLVARGTLSLTSSGKLRRQHARALYLRGALSSLVRCEQPAQRDATYVEQLLCEELGKMLDLPTSKVDPTVTFAQLGLDSVTALEVAGRLEANFELEIEPENLYANPTPRRLACWIAECAR